MGNSSDSDGDQTGNIKQLPLIKGGGSNMNMMNMQHMNNSFHHNSSQISETTYSMKAENQLVGGKKKNSSTFNTSKYMAHSPSPSQTFFKGKSSHKSHRVQLLFMTFAIITVHLSLSYDILSFVLIRFKQKGCKKGPSAIRQCQPEVKDLCK